MTENGPVASTESDGAQESSSYLVVFALAAAVTMLTAALAADVAGLDALRGVASRFDPRWLAICVGAQVVSYLGYVLALRHVAGVDEGPRLSFQGSARTVVAGFGVHGASQASGGFAVDYWALRKAGLKREDAIARIACLGTLELAVLAPLGLVSAIILLVADAQIRGSVTWPWLLVVPGLVAALWVTAPHRHERLTGCSGRGRIRAAFGHALTGLVLVRSVAVNPRRHLPGLVGVALFVGGDMACLWGALKAFSVDIHLAPLVLAYATGSVASRRSLPAGGAGMVEVLMTCALVWVGIPLAPALAAVLLHRLVSFWLPIVPSLALLPYATRLRREVSGS